MQSQPESNNQLEPFPLIVEGQLEGYLARISGGSLVGWCRSPNSPELRLRVALYDGDEQLLSTLAVRYRPDVEQSGLGDGYYGFKLQIPPRSNYKNFHLRIQNHTFSPPDLTQNTNDHLIEHGILATVDHGEATGWLTIPPGFSHANVLVSIKRSETLLAQTALTITPSADGFLDVPFTVPIAHYGPLTSVSASLEVEDNALPLLVADSLFPQNEAIPISESFNADYYFHINRIRHEFESEPTWAELILHFSEIGIRKLYPYNETLQFDPIEYVDLNPDLKKIQTLDESDLYHHWIDHGQHEARNPNVANWLKRDLGINTTNLQWFNHQAYSELSGHKFDSAVDALKDYISKKPEFTLECLGCCPTHLFPWIQLAQHFQTKSANDGTARLIFETLLSSEHSDSSFLYEAYGDFNQTQSSYLSATYYSKTQENSTRKDDTALALKCANAWASSNQHRRAIAQLIKHIPGTSRTDEFNHIFLVQLDREIKKSQLKAKVLARRSIENYSSAIGVTRDLCDYVKATFESAYNLPDKSYCERTIQSILLIADQSLYQCDFYRVKQKVAQLEAAGLEVTLIDGFTDFAQSFIQALNETDAAIIYRLPGTSPILDAIYRLRAAGIPTFYEIDDLIFDEYLYPESWESYSNSISRDLYDSLVFNTPLYALAASCCDFGIASTEALEKHLNRYVSSGVSLVHRNAFSDEHLKAIERNELRRPKTSKTVTILYGSATKAHKQDCYDLLVPALHHVLTKFGKQVNIILVGYFDLPNELTEFRDQISILPPSNNISDYWQIVSTADINCSVLHQSAVTDCKSEIKWMEASMLGIPSILSRTAGHEEVVEDGVTGILVSNSEEWKASLENLVADEDLRIRIGHAAKHHVCNNYQIDQMGKSLHTALADTVSKNTNPQKSDKRKQKVLIVNVFYAPQAIGGATRVVIDNICDMTKLAPDELEIEVFTTHSGSNAYSTTSYFWEGCRVTAVTTPALVDHDRLHNDAKMGDVFDRFLERFNPDLVHFHCIQRLTGSIVEATQHRGIPYYITAHDGWWISDHQFLVDNKGDLKIYPVDEAELLSEFPQSFGRATYLRNLLQSAEAVLAVSDSFAKIYTDYGLNNVESIPNGVSKLATLDRPIRENDARIRLGHVGGKELHKGLPLIQSILLEHDFTRLSLLVVDHAMPTGHETHCVWGNTPVKIIGKYPQSKVNQLYTEFDILLAPSIWPESFGLVAREAMMAGCWVIGSNRGSIASDIDDNSNGYIIDIANREEVVRRLKNIDNRFKPNKIPKANQKLRKSPAQAEDLLLKYTERISQKN